MDSPRKIGKYEILERIGHGGFGFVYKGRDPFIKRLVAVKLCTSSDETLRKRFVREAEIAGNLHHRYIVTVFEFGYDDAGPFLIQEYLPGEDLDQTIRRQASLDQATRLRYLLQIARALDYAHKKGVLHRDIKPGNVRVLEDGRIKILDFGIAKLAGAETQLTRTGRVLGTAGYLSPEQLKGEVVDARSDVFSFGVLAYELLAYEHPFPGTTISELLDQVVHTEPRPLPSAVPDCPTEVGAMIMRCLAKDPEQRYAGFPEVTEVLSTVLADLETSEATVRPGPTPEETLVGSGGDGSRGGGRSVRGAAALSEDDLEATQLVEPLPPETPREPPVDWGSHPDSRTEAVTEAGSEPPRGGETGDREASRVGADGLVGRLIFGAVVTLLIVAAAAAIWWIAGSPETGPEADEAPEAAAGLEAEATVLVDAVPWARLMQVTDAEGRPFPLPPETTTPLTLRLPPGEYTLKLIHPQANEPATCTVYVEEDAAGRCRLELVRIDARDYLQEAGWWR